MFQYYKVPAWTLFIRGHGLISVHICTYWKIKLEKVVPLMPWEG